MTDIRRVETLMRGHEAFPFVNPNKWPGGQYRGPYLMSANRLHGDSFPFWFQAAQAAPYPINTWWPVLVPWFIVTAEEDPSNPYATNNTATNVRVQIRNQKLYIRRSSWSLVQTLASPPSDLFAYDLSSFSSFGGYRDESADGGGNSVMVQSGGTIVPHGYGTPFNVPNPQEVTGIAVEIESRLVLNNPAGTDDRAAARYLISIACDLYPENFSSLPAVGWWPAVGAAGFARVTTGWQKMGFNTYFSAARPDMDVDALRSAYSSTLILADAPSGWTDGGGGEVIPPPTPLPTNAQRLLFIGDAYVSGNESVANSWRTWRGKALLDLTAAGLPVDAIGREVSASSLRPTDPEHDGYSGAYISTTTNSIADRLDAILTNAGGVTYSSGGVPGPGDVIVTDARGVAAAVLMLGLTDYESAPTGIADRYSALFADVRLGLPAADLVVVTLPPRQGLTEAATNAAYPGYAALNTRIREIAAATYGVTLANAAAAALVPADYQGAALLLQSGADKVGAIIADALGIALGAGSGYIIPGAPTRPTVSLREVSSNLHVFKWGSTAAAPAIVTTALTGGEVGQPYLVDLDITGDPAPTVTVDPSPPFPGVTLSGKRISGASLTTAGSYTFTVSAASTAGSTATKTFTVTVAAPTVITTTTLASVVAGTPFAAVFQATGSGPFTWSISDRGTLPAGPEIVVDTLSGTVATAGVYTFTVAAVGQSGSDTQALSLTVTENIVVPTPVAGSWVRLPRDAEVWVRVPRDES